MANFSCMSVKFNSAELGSLNQTACLHEYWRVGVRNGYRNDEREQTEHEGGPGAVQLRWLIVCFCSKTICELQWAGTEEM